MTLSREIAQTIRTVRAGDTIPDEVVSKAKLVLMDMLACALEARDLPASRRAMDLARRAPGPATVFGTDVRACAREAAFANATAAHGLVREDMHTGSVSHLGVVVLPTVLAVAETSIEPVSGRSLIRAVLCGYEVGAAIGNAVMDPETVRRFRPTGITGPLGAAAAGGLLAGLSEDALTSAIGFAANSTVGLNEWPASGADEMYFHAGFAARNAITAVELAEMGAYASETALDGPAGLFAALDRRSARVALFSGAVPQILSVYHKPAPACNYAQTACQAALALDVDSREIASIEIRGTAAALAYPGCNSTGPFERSLKAKMSIQYSTAATLARRSISEANYQRLDDPEVIRLIGITTLREDPELTQAYPAKQGAEVAVTLRDGRILRRRQDDVIPASSAQIRHRFRSACEGALGKERARTVQNYIDDLEHLANARELSQGLALQTAMSTKS